MDYKYVSNHEVVVVWSLLAEHEVDHVAVEAVHPDWQKPDLVVALVLLLLLARPLLLPLLVGLVEGSLLVGLEMFKMWASEQSGFFAVVQEAAGEDGVDDLDLVVAEVANEEGLVLRPVVLHPQTGQDVADGTVLLLHLLVVTPALLGLPAPHEHRHRLENLVRASHVFI